MTLWSWHSVLEFFGVVGESGKGYAFFSGVGSDLGELAIVSVLIGVLKHHTCHVHRCWRIGRHAVTGTDHVVCRKHHPDGHLTHDHLLRLHRAHLDKVAASTDTTVTTQDH